MAIDPRNLKPADLARLLNSTPLGPVIDERHLYRHRMRAGFRIGDGRRVDLFRYVAWLVEQRFVSLGFLFSAFATSVRAEEFAPAPEPLYVVIMNHVEGDKTCPPDDFVCLKSTGYQTVPLPPAGVTLWNGYSVDIAETT